METSKQKQGKISPFGERIIKVLSDNDLIKQNGEVNYSEAERLCQIGQSILSKAVKRTGMGKENFEKFHGYFHVEPKWLKTGKGDQYKKNVTPVPEIEKKQPVSEEVRLLILNLNRFGETNEYLLKRIRELGG